MHHPAGCIGLSVEVHPAVGIWMPEAGVAAEGHAGVDRRPDDGGEEQRERPNGHDWRDVVASMETSTASGG